jgi:DNA repair protein RadA/Sms
MPERQRRVPGMPRARIEYQCSACGATHTQWAGQCSDCGAWNTLEEQSLTPTSRARAVGWAGAQAARAVSIGEVSTESQTRIPTGISELDRVLGGGLIGGAVILLGGDPGIGKSTLLLQTLAALDDATTGLYVSGEESNQQVGLRAQRLGLNSSSLRLLSETGVERILATLEQLGPTVVVIDSIQTLYSEALQSAPGSVSQVRETAAMLVRYAKQTGATLLFIGHVTKEGQLAGPRVLEHMVDTVLYFEGDAGSRFRMIRAVKNRFGAVNELGIFAMTERGLRPVANPSAIFLSRHEQPVPGSVILVTREGTRPLLVEVQALVAESHLSNPRRVAVGLDANRLAMLLAVLTRHGGPALYDHDVFVNVVGGVRVTETAADLPLVIAALSSFRDQPLPVGMVAFGEIGLAGELRPVPDGQQRLREAAKHGFGRAIVPAANAPKQPLKDLEVVPIRTLGEALDAI